MENIRVRVKDDMVGFIYGYQKKGRVIDDKGKIEYPGDEFDLVPVEHSIKTKNGKPLVITPEEQFSKNWMERISPVEEVFKKTDIDEPVLDKPKRGRPKRAINES